MTLNFLIRRVLTALLTLVLSSALVFSALLIVPGDPVQLILGLNYEPAQYALLKTQNQLHRIARHDQQGAEHQCAREHERQQRGQHTADQEVQRHSVQSKARARATRGFGGGRKLPAISSLSRFQRLQR